MRKLKQVVVILKKFQEQYMIQKIINVSQFSIIAKIKRHINIAIDSNTPTYIRGNKAYYFVEIDSNNNAKHLVFQQNSSFSVDVLDIFINQHVLKDITKSLAEPKIETWKQNIMPFLLGLTIGAFVVFIYMQSQQTNLLT